MGSRLRGNDVDGVVAMTDRGLAGTPDTVHLYSDRYLNRKFAVVQ
jgi:hypothetical protein